ncbi:MAG: 4Fe-4S binding protein [Elusimicrobiota bacterium]
MSQKIAIFLCNGADNCSNRFIYEGVKTCRASEMFFTGPKACSSSCLGFGDCVSSCSKGAILHYENKMPEIDINRCDGCGECISSCPKKIISLISRRKNVVIRCLSIEKSNYIRQICKNGCISCGICAKVCPSGTIVIDSTVARIDLERCDLCGLCIEKCPTNSISRVITSEL